MMTKLLRMFILYILALQCLGSCALFEKLPQAAPESVGLSQEGLAEITTLMQAQVADEKLAGAVALVARRGKIAYLQAVGQQDREADLPMDTRSIFRIASMTCIPGAVASVPLSRTIGVLPRCCSIRANSRASVCCSRVLSNS